MKTLKLKAFDLGADEILTRSQLKNVLGGDVKRAASARYQCCWINDPSNCSKCVDTRPNYTCAEDSLAVVC